MQGDQKSSRRDGNYKKRIKRMIVIEKYVKFDDAPASMPSSMNIQGYPNLDPTRLKKLQYANELKEQVKIFGCVFEWLDENEAGKETS